MSKATQFKNSLLYMVPVLVGNVLPIITLPLFTRVLSPQDYGIYALAQVYAIFMAGVSNFGLITGYERNFFEHTDEVKRAGLLYSVLAFSVLSFVVFGFLTFIFKGHLAQWIIGSNKHGSILFWSFCVSGLTNLKTYYLTYFKNTLNAKAFAWYTIDENLIGMVVSLVLVLYFKNGIIGLVWGQLAASLVITIFLAYKFLRVLPVTLNWELLRQSLLISVPLTPRIFFGVIGNQFDKYLIGLLSTSGGVGIYSIGQKFAYIVFTFMTAVQNMFSPQVYKMMFEDGDQASGLIGKYLTPFIYVCVAGGLGIAMFGEEAIMLLTPKSYHDAINIISILALLYSTYFFGKLPQLIYAKKTGITSLLTLLSIALNILINIPFITIWGVTGAACGTLLAGLISVCVTFKVSEKYYKIEWEVHKLVLIYLSLFIFVGLSILLRELEVIYSIRLILKGSMFALYILIGVKVGVITKDTIHAIKLAVGSR